MMLLRQLGAAALGLAVAQAFLLPSEITDSAIDTINGLSFDQAANADVREVDVACPGCVLTFEKEDGEIKTLTDKKSHLELNFAIEHQASGDRLVVNGFELYPNPDPLDHVLTAPHKPDCNKKHKAKKSHHKDGEKKWGKHRNHKFVSERLGFALGVHPVTVSGDDKMELIAVDLQIIEVADTFVDGIPTVHVALIQTPEGGLMIGSVETVATQTEATPMEKPECTTLLCKWMSMIESALPKFKPFPLGSKHCGGKGKGKGMGKVVPVKADEDDETPKPPHHHPHHHHHHHHHKGGHKHSWAQLFKSIAAHILLPILIGIIAGVSVSIIGTMVGTCIVAFWRTFFRRHRHVGHAHHRAVQKEVAATEEKTGLMEQQEAPPAYEEDADKTTSA